MDTVLAIRRGQNVQQIDEYVGGIPHVSGAEEWVAECLERRQPLVFLPDSPIDFNHIESACAIALHMHQPLIPGGADLQNGELICNLQDMMAHPEVGDNRKASVFHECYRRPAELIPELVEAGHQPRLMLDYSGSLLHGFRQMGLHDVITALQAVTRHSKYQQCIEWLGAPWGHAVAPSTPVQDYRLHVKAFQQHFGAIFGAEALSRLRGFSPAEMALPNHPEVAYEFVKTLRDAGYTWVLLQQQTVETLEGKALKNPHLPHRLICRNAAGEEVSIIAIIKSYRSDSRLVARMQCYEEALSLQSEQLGHLKVPPLVTQIADGENGLPMMQEFPKHFRQVVERSSHSKTPMMNATDYLENLFARGVKEADFTAIQPRHQHLLWQRLEPGSGLRKMQNAITELKRENSQFNVDGGSWTAEISWVEGYANVLKPMDEASALFSEKMLKRAVAPSSPDFREALFLLMSAETSCYRYWGQGRWTDFGQEISRRTIAFLDDVAAD